MNIHEENQTKKWIIDALFELLRNKEYHDITIARITDKAGLGRRTFYRYFKTKDEVIENVTQSLMNEFADTVIKNQAETLEAVIKSYFEFWENYVDILLLLKKAHLLYFIEDNLLSLFYGVALKVGHGSPERLDDDEIEVQYDKHIYEFTFKLAGLWKCTLFWCSESPRKTPEEMSRRLCEFLK